MSIPILISCFDNILRICSSENEVCHAPLLFFCLVSAKIPESWGSFYYANAGLRRRRCRLELASGGILDLLFGIIEDFFLWLMLLGLLFPMKLKRLLRTF